MGYASDCSTAYNRAAPQMNSQPASRPDVSTLADSPVTQQTLFVGREHELTRLKAAFDAAVGGHGSLLMLVGEPGVGKTTLAEQFLAFAIQLLARTLVGHCYGSGGPAMPYIAFAEAIDGYVLSCDLAALRAEVGDDIAEAARLAPQLR